MQTSVNPSTQPQPLSAPVLREPHTSVDSAYAYYVLAVLFLVYIFNFIDRQILAILLQPIKEDLKISDTALGFLTGAGFLTRTATGSYIRSAAGPVAAGSIEALV
jgi:sugar phosphate permease